MAHTLIDIHNNLLKYNKTELIIIIDDKTDPWFFATRVAEILGYGNPTKAIQTNVDEIDKKEFRELEKYLEIDTQIQAQTIFINEPGLYSLIIFSRKPIAKDFLFWIIRDVIPSIRKTGSYTVNEKYEEELENIEEELENIKDKLKECRREKKVLRNNQKTKDYKRTGLVYIIRPIKETNKKLIKPGKTKNSMGERLDAYNVTPPDNVEVLFSMEVDNPSAVEDCAKSLMSKFMYRDGKEYYECTIKKLKSTINLCNHLIHANSISKNGNLDMSSFNKFIKENDVKKNEKLQFNIAYSQEGGTEDFISIKNKSGETMSDIYISKDAFRQVKTYCDAYLYPHIDHTQKVCYECDFPDLSDILHCICKIDNTNRELCEIIIDNDLDPTDKIIIDLKPLEQSGGGIGVDADKFNSQVKYLPGEILLPNGYRVLHNGKVIPPN